MSATSRTGDIVQYIHLLDLLLDFPTCNPPLAHLLYYLTRHRVRYYSIACSPVLSHLALSDSSAPSKASSSSSSYPSSSSSSPSTSPSSSALVHICFGYHEFSVKSTKRSQQQSVLRGVCSGWLRQLGETFLQDHRLGVTLGISPHLTSSHLISPHLSSPHLPIPLFFCYM